MDAILSRLRGFLLERKRDGFPSTGDGMLYRRICPDGLLCRSAFSTFLCYSLPICSAFEALYFVPIKKAEQKAGEALLPFVQPCTALLLLVCNHERYLFFFPVGMG